MAILMLVMTALSMLAVFVIAATNNYYLNIKKVSLIKSHFIKKLIKKNFLRWVSIAICIFCIVVYILIRWSVGIENIIKYDLFNKAASEFRSANISIALMLDLCSFLGVFLPILIIFDWKKRILLRPVALLSLLGGCATIFFTIPELYSHYWDARIFFLGSTTIGASDSDEPLMFMMHYWMILMASIVIVTDRKVTLKEYLKTVGLILTYATYISLCAKFIDIRSHVTATVIGDFEKLPAEYYEWFKKGDGHPSYKIFVDIYNAKSWEGGAVAAWLTFAVIVTLIVFFKNLAQYVGIKKSLIINSQDQFPIFDHLANKLKRKPVVS